MFQVIFRKKLQLQLFICYLFLCSSHVCSGKRNKFKGFVVPEPEKKKIYSPPLIFI